MAIASCLLVAALCGQVATPALPAATTPATGRSLLELAGAETVATTPALINPATGAFLPPPDAAAAAAWKTPRGLFQSDREFEGFVGPLSNPINFKDPRALTEARLLFLNNWGARGTPVLGTGSIQVYALQLRVALTERLQLFADKDGIVRLSPNPGGSVTGLANINAGAKYALIRDVENQFLFNGIVQYEAPTGYANIFQNQGSGNLALFGQLAKEIGDWHFILQFGQNFRMKTTNSGYFMTSAHVDRRFGRFVPFYEANWFYYNQNGTHLAAPFEGGGLINIGAQGIAGVSWVTNAVGFKYDISKNLHFGLGYEFQLSEKTQLLNNQVIAELIFRY
jgi:hypothetical protein